MSKGYWEDYNALQYYKHEILKRYLDRWYPILSSFNNRILFFDCFAGKGKHKTGEEGSPLVALKQLLNHKNRNKILRSTKVDYIFIEFKTKHTKNLEQELNKLKPLPQNVTIKIINNDFEKSVSSYLNIVKKKYIKFPPSFFFVDPFGFKLSLKILNRILSYRYNEILINFMYRYINIAINNPNHGQEENLNNLFGTTEWKYIKNIDNPEEREKYILNLFTSQLSSTYNIKIPFLGGNNATKYYLIHSSNDKKAVEKMKEAIWKSIPKNNFKVSIKDKYKYYKLIKPKINLHELELWLWDNFTDKEIYITKIYNKLINTIYRKKHLHKIIKIYRNHGIIKCKNYEGKFAFSKNPKISFPPSPTYTKNLN